MLALWSAFLVSLLYGLMRNIFAPSNEQVIVLNKILITRKAAICIQHSIRYFFIKKKINSIEINKTEKKTVDEKLNQKHKCTFSIILNTNQKLHHDNNMNDPLISDDDVW